MQDETWMKYVFGDQDDPKDMQASLSENLRNIRVLEYKYANKNLDTPTYDILELNDRRKAEKFITNRILELETKPVTDYQQQWNEHVELLKSDLSLLDVSDNDLRYAYAYTPSRKLPQLPEKKTGAELFGWIIEALGQGSLISPPPPLLLFANALRRNNKGDLGGWIERGCRIWGVTPGSLAVLNPDTDEWVLQIAIYNEGKEQYSLRGWVWPPNGLECNISPNPNRLYTKEQLRQPVNQLFKQGIQEILVPDRFQIEFFLPHQLLFEPIHAWPCPDDDEPDYKASIAFCRNHLVVVRSADRALAKYATGSLEEMRRLWKEKWRRLKAATIRRPIHRLKPPTHPSDLWFDDLAVTFRDWNTLCFAETGAFFQHASLTAEVVRNAIRYGLPAGVWLKAGAPASVYRELDHLVSGPLHELPARITKRRKAGGENVLREPLILFWDNYDRLPSGHEDYQFG